MSPRPKPRFGVSYPYATYSDLQELLNRPWITRLWTYQEILLATSPVMVCGDRHVPWPEFELSICFLGNIETFSLLQIIHPWVNLILSRERLQKYDLAFRNSLPTALESYGLFVRKVSKAKTGNLDAQSALAILTVLAALDIGSILGMSVPGLFISSIISIIFLFTVAKYRLQHVRGSSDFANEGFTIGLYHRNAKERRDMAFGMWAVLERGGALNLPAPDASLDYPDIYRTFATHISQITQRADLILLAAIQGFDDQPSWVPDWSAHGNNNWAYDVAAIDKSDDFGDRSNLRALSTRPQVSFVFKERDTVLSIRARHVCEVYNCFRFQQANARDPDESVDAIHLDNLRIILELASSRPLFPAGSSRAFVNEAFGFETMTSIATFTNSNLFPFFILETLDLELEETMPQLNKAQFTRWRSFCISNCRKTPAEAMTLLQNAPDIRQIQITMCNLLSSENKTLFYAATAGNKPWTKIFGCGSHGVENGDSIVRFQGVPQRLIVRKIFPSTARGGHAVKLVSPCHESANEHKPTPLETISHGGPTLQGPPTHVSFEAERTYRKNHLAAAFRHWSRKGYVFGFSGHISYRDPEFPKAFWKNPLGVHFGLLRASDMLLVDLDGRIVGGNRSRLANTAGFLIYAAVHMARGDVHAVCHCHSPAGKAWSAVGRRLDMLTQDACKFLGDAHAVRRVRRRRPRG
ncbi:hypothetical protein PG989_015112 [Apiospora arundinis]